MYRQLKAEDVALVLIDHQVISMTLTRTHPLDIVEHNIAALVRASVVLDIPNVWTSSTEDDNEDWWLPSLADAHPKAFANRVKRTGVIDAWNEPDFVRAIEATGRRTLIMSGTSNDGCLLYPALQARAAGYEVHAVVDAGGSAFEASEAAARTRMAHAGVVLTATGTVLGELARDWSTPDGGSLRTILADTFRNTIGEFGLER